MQRAIRPSRARSDRAERDVEPWRGGHAEANDQVIRVRRELAAAQARYERVARQMAALLDARHQTIMNSYDGVIGTLMQLQVNSAGYSNDSFASAQRAFRNDVQDRLAPVEAYRYDFGEVQTFFNEEITELLEDLESGRLTEPEAMQRRIDEAPAAFELRRATLGRALQIMDHLQAKIIGE